MRRIGWLLLTASLLAGGLGAMAEAEAFDVEVEVEDSLLEPVPVSSPAPSLHREFAPSALRADDGAARTLRPARPPPLR